MPREILGLPAGRPYSPGTKAGNLVFVSGQIGLGADGRAVGDDVATQTRACLKQIRDVLAAGGATLDDVTMVNIYVTDLETDFAPINEVYREFFPTDPPARATVEVSKLAFGLKVEISCMAVIR